MVKTTNGWTNKISFFNDRTLIASSDATNIQTSIVKDGDEYIINGKKWWSSGAMNPSCKMFIVMGKTNPEQDRHHQQSMIIVPSDSPWR